MSNEEIYKEFLEKKENEIITEYIDYFKDGIETSSNYWSYSTSKSTKRKEDYNIDNIKSMLKKIRDLYFIHNHIIKKKDPITSISNLQTYNDDETKNLVYETYKSKFDMYYEIMKKMRYFLKDTRYKTKTFKEWLCSNDHGDSRECLESKKGNIEDSRFNIYPEIFDYIQQQHFVSPTGGKRTYKRYNHKKSIKQKKYKFKKNYT